MLAFIFEVPNIMTIKEEPKKALNHLKSFFKMEEIDF